MNNYYIETTLYTESYTNKIEKFFGEKPEVIGTDGIYTIYSLETVPTTENQKWIVGSTREAMLQAGLIVEVSPETSEQSTIVCVWMFASKGWAPCWQARALESGEKEDHLKEFKTEAEAWAFVAQFPNQKIVETIGEYMAAYKSQLAALGTSFEHMSIVAR